MKKYTALLLGFIVLSAHSSEFQKKKMPSSNKVALQIKAFALAAAPGCASFFCVRALLNMSSFSYSAKIALGSSVLLTILLQRSICRLAENHFWVNYYNQLVDFLDEIEHDPSLLENSEQIKKVEEALKGLILWNLAGHGVAEQDRKDIVAIAEKIGTLL